MSVIYEVVGVVVSVVVVVMFIVGVGMVVDVVVSYSGCGRGVVAKLWLR